MFSLTQHQGEINQICSRYPVRQLALFGSAVTDRFDESSDVDILVEFEDGDDIDFFGVYFRLKESLEEAFQRPVDLVVDRPFSNPIFQDSVNRSRRMIYERKSA